MEINLIHTGGITLAELVSPSVEIATADDALDLIGNCGYQGAVGVIIHQHHLAPEFFDLKTGLAGEVLQKFSNYAMKLAIVGDFAAHAGKSLSDFMRESNRAGHVNFVGSLPEAREKLRQR